MMRQLRLSDVAQAVGGVMQGDDCALNQISTDTRQLAAGDLFVALKGEVFDGHDYLQQALHQGAGAVLAEGSRLPAGVVGVGVGDTRRALGDLAYFNRSLSAAKVCAITGSCGKTTVKEMLAAILSLQAPTLATQGNLNNDIGVPLTLFRLSPEHQFAVIEMGASGPQEIAWCGRLAQPHVGVLTNAGEAHLQGFGSYQGIVQAKGEIVEAVAPDGCVVLNGDDPAFSIWMQRAGSRQVIAVSVQKTQAQLLTGFSQGMAYTLAEAKGQPCKGLSDKGLSDKVFLALCSDGWQLTVKLALPGMHNRLNALLAIAAARAMGADDRAIHDGLLQVKAAKGRLQVCRLSAGITLIDDSYNANPTAMKAAIQVLAAQAGQKVAVFGAIAELGPTAPALLASVGEAAAQAGIDHLVLVGPSGADYARGFQPLAKGVCHLVKDHAEALAQVSALRDATADEMVVLVKGSRSAAMDKLVVLLIQKYPMVGGAVQPADGSQPVDKVAH